MESVSTFLLEIHEVEEAMQWSLINSIVAIAALAITVINLLGMAVLRATLTTTQLDNAQLKEEIVKLVAARDATIVDKMDRIAASFGEVAASIREHANVELGRLRAELHESNLHMRDNYVRRESFDKVVSDMRAMLDSGVKELRSDISRLEDVVMNRSR